jgi:cytochrome c oxidase subunit 2
VIVTVSCAGCSGVQSALDPAGAEAEQIASLTIVMVAGAACIWLAVVGLLLFALRRRREPLHEDTAGRLILWGGAIFPSVTLLALLGYALWLMPSLRPFAAEAGDPMQVEVTGRQFWWQVTYRRAGAEPVITANEIRLPVGQRVEFTLKSDDVIHSFWIPSLGGKMDMIPGRTNRLSLLAVKEGTFRSPCAEYCGTSHALMALVAVAMPRQAFEDWLAAQAAPAPRTAEGFALFQRHGCGACHRIAGTPAQAAVGPDLTRLGARLTLGAGILPNTEHEIARFIAAPDLIKPGAKMPRFDMLPEGDIAAMARYLKALQ